MSYLIKNGKRHFKQSPHNILDDRGKNMKYCCIRQHDITDCGAACLATIAKQNGYHVSIVYSVSSAPRVRSFRTTLTEDENHPHEKCTAT